MALEIVFTRPQDGEYVSTKQKCTVAWDRYGTTWEEDLLEESTIRLCMIEHPTARSEPYCDQFPCKPDWSIIRQKKTLIL